MPAVREIHFQVTRPIVEGYSEPMRDYYAIFKESHNRGYEFRFIGSTRPACIAKEIQSALKRFWKQASKQASLIST